MTSIFHGSCLCGAVRYQLNSAPKAVSHCHCSQCRKGHGAAFASYGNVLRTDLQFNAGEDVLKTYQSSAKAQRQFCGQCGASLFWSSSEGDYTGWISVALGTLDTPLEAPKQKHLHVDDKAPWHTITDGWPQA